MKFRELSAWIKKTKNLDEQVSLAMQEDEEVDDVLEEVGKVCYQPFKAASLPARTIKNTFCPESHRIYIEMWEYLDRFTWGEFVHWIDNLKDPNIEATALAAWHLCKLKTLKNGMLYAYECE